MYNKLFLNRLVIFTNGGKIAYDENFHLGVNIIRGKNSSGKSTISQFIFYALGGAFNDWVKEARECSKVYAEIIINNSILTIKRDIVFNIKGEGIKTQPMEFYWGDYLQASSNAEGWLKFNYNKTENLKSFSDVLFENLDIPIVKGDNNITMHQILRLLYVDQDSPTNSLFLYEHFDTTLTRETVSNLLLGVYNQDLYDAQQDLEKCNKDYNILDSEISVIKKFTANKNDLNPIYIKTKIANKEKEIDKIDDQIVKLKSKNNKIRFTSKSKLQFELLNESAIKQRIKTKELSNKINTYSLEIEDTVQFIKTLESKRQAIKNSIKTREFLGEYSMDNCPQCLQRIELKAEEGTCSLCKSPNDNSIGTSEARKIEQEIYFQIEESRKINKRKNNELTKLQSELISEKEKLVQIQNQVNNSLNDVRTFKDEKIDHLYGEKGFIEGEIIQLCNLLENAELYSLKVEEYNKLVQKIAYLEYSIKEMLEGQNKRKTKVNKKIETIGVYLLNNDLKTQKDFFEAKEFNIDYRNNLAFISDKNAKYSASSSFYLKNSARFAIFLASLSESSMRYPRFILCDNMEDKGIHIDRVHNFQKILIDYLEKVKDVEYQVIYTTSFIPEELNNTKYCIGDFYNEENPTLKYV
ncbi:hypothetical protein ACKUSY_16265 [Myroides odoratus]